jgi:DNA-binding response OmpR family regulator
MNDSPAILVVEDEPAMLAGLKDNLEIEGYRVMGAATLREAREAALKRSPDLLLLDLMLPDGNGTDLCRELRSRDVDLPIIILTAKGEEMDRVLGLENGADDYVVKPFSLRELFARIRAHLRRNASRDTTQAKVRIGAAEVDFSRHTLMRDGQVCEISAKELEVLRFLYVRRGKVVPRETLLAEVWGYPEDVVTRSVDNFIARLRKKIEPEPSHPRYLLTVHGSGYKLIVLT